MNQSKIICMWFSNMPHPTDELFPIFTRLKGNVLNDMVNLMCHLQQLFPFFSGHDPNFTVSWCRANSQKGSLWCCFFSNPVIIPPAALLQRFYLNAGSNCTESAAAQYKYIIILLNIPLLAVMFLFPPDSESWTATAENVTEEQSQRSELLSHISL